MWFQNKSPERGTVAKRAIGSLAPSRGGRAASSNQPVAARTTEAANAQRPSARPERPAEDFGPITVPPPIQVLQPQPVPTATARSQRIADMSEVPAGTLISAADGEFPLNAADRQNTAIFRTSVKTCVTLVTSAMWGSAYMFEVRRRLRAELDSESSEVLADPALINMLYEQHRPTTKSGRVSASDATDAEKFVWSLIEQGVEAQASDIHVESRGNHADVFFRINGERQRVSSLSMEQATSFGRVLYTIYAEDSSKEAAWDQSKMQDSVIEHTTSNQLRVQLRFSSGPIYPSPNFHIVIRILHMSVVAKKSLEDMGYTRRMARAMDNMLAGARGCVVMVGPTNSGKSTTLQALLARVFERRGSTIKMITAEDPVEYLIPGAVQIGVPHKRKSMTEEGSAFTSILRGALRQDPDVLMVGEMRDRESAALVKDAVLTGRKLFTTLHANSAVTAFVRLREIGVEWDVLTSPGFISGIIYQRLLPVMCDKCRISIREGAHRLDGDTLIRLETVIDPTVDQVFVRGDGCSHCNNTGYVGRTVCAELLTPDLVFLQHMANNRVLDAEQHWLKNGDGATDDSDYPTVLSHAITKMRAGLIDPRDIELQVDLLTQDTVRLSGAPVQEGRLGPGARLSRRASQEAD